MNNENTKTHSSKAVAEFSFEHADIKSICYCKTEGEKPTATFFRMRQNEALQAVHTTSFTSHLHSSCGMVWYRTVRAKVEGCLFVCLLVA